MNRLAIPIEGTSHADARRYHVQDGNLRVDDLPLPISPPRALGTAPLMSWFYQAAFAANQLRRSL